MADLLAVDKCWCGAVNPYCCEAPASEGCGGAGWIECLCGGDQCVCHNHGQVACDGCPDCTEEGDDG